MMLVPTYIITLISLRTLSHARFEFRVPFRAKRVDHALVAMGWCGMSAGVPVQHKFEVLINSTVSQTEHKFEVRQTEQAMDGLGSSRRGLWCGGPAGVCARWSWALADTPSYAHARPSVVARSLSPSTHIPTCHHQRGRCWMRAADRGIAQQ